MDWNCCCSFGFGGMNQAMMASFDADDLESSTSQCSHDVGSLDRR